MLESRELGSFPVSISTALAFDGLYGKHPTYTMRKDASTLAPIVYINLRTMFRNIYTSVPERADADSTSDTEYAHCLLNEMKEITAHLKGESNPLAVKFYLPTYKSLARYYGEGNLKLPKTDLQKKKILLENQVANKLLDLHRTSEGKVDFMVVDMDIRLDEYSKAFIMTHLPMDLLNVKNCSEVLLLESHTGAVKGSNGWFSKLNGDRNPRMPFNKATMLFYGDTGGIFAGQPRNFRKRLTEIAEVSKWNFATSKDRILSSILKEKEVNILQVMKSFF